MYKSLPKYAGRLEALHKALEKEFRDMVGKVGARPDQLVLDIGCGDGFFTKLLAENGSQVVGLDTSEAFLWHANSTHHGAANINYVKGAARKLPYEDASVDVVWSAHSFQSYPSIQQCLGEFYRVLRPGGLVAILESDNIHSVLLSWPPDLELAVRQAEYREIGDEDSYMGTYFPRFAMRLLTLQGFRNFKTEYRFVHRLGPAEESLKEFVTLYLQNLSEVTSNRLSENMQLRLARLADAHSDTFLPEQESFFFGSLQVLVTARK